MALLTILGIGPGDPELLTRRADRILREAERIILRTGEHEVADYLTREGIAFSTLDALYDEAEDFDEIEELSARFVRNALREGDLIYAVPGHGLLSDGTVQRLLGMHLRIRLEPGLSQADLALAVGAKSAREASDGLLQLPAALVQPGLVFSRVPLLVTELDDPMQAGEVKLALQQVYGEEAVGYLIRKNRVKKLPLEELDRISRLDHTDSYYLPGADDSARMDIGDLLDVMEVLRRECAWDRRQTHESLRTYLLEETAEVLDAIDRDDPQELAEELGDLLYQIVFHASISQAAGDFDFRDVTDAICRKMIRRHPSIFAGTDGDDEADWVRAKAQEKADAAADPMSCVPQTLPALSRAQKMAGYETSSVDAAGLAGELTSLAGEDAAAGDFLYRLCLHLKSLGIDAEMSLRDACRRRAAQKILK